MGYDDLIGSRKVRKKSGKCFRNELFTFNEGTAVNVTFSPDGQISMELGGLSREDRIPTADETEILTRDMESFCGEFVEFERRMLAKGIVVGSRIALSPPSAEYAAIINVNDYDVAESTQISVMNATDTLDKPLVVVGREADLKEYLQSKLYVSRQHARMTVVADKVFIENLSRTNKTYLNNEEIPDGTPTALGNGDEIGLGGKEIDGSRQDKRARGNACPFFFNLERLHSTTHMPAETDAPLQNQF